jgi:hypothetical protein
MDVGAAGSGEITQAKKGRGGHSFRKTAAVDHSGWRPLSPSDAHAGNTTRLSISSWTRRASPIVTKLVPAE